MCEHEKTRIAPHIRGECISDLPSLYLADSCEPSTGSVSSVRHPSPIASPSCFVQQINSLVGRKSTLEDYLVSRHSFTSIHLESVNHPVRIHKFAFVFFTFLPFLFLSLVPRPPPLRHCWVGNFQVPVPSYSTATILSSIWKLLERADPPYLV